jgi:hypothetical protein
MDMHLLNQMYVKQHYNANPTLALQIQTLPDGPGVYQYYDKDGKSCM